MVKQKIVIKVSMKNAKSRSRAMVIAAKANGVSKIEITGNLSDQLEVVGDGVNINCLVKCLSKKLCDAQIIKVEEVKPEDKVKKDPKKSCDCPATTCICVCPATPYHCYHTPLHPVFCDEEPRGFCHIM